MKHTKPLSSPLLPRLAAKRVSKRLAEQHLYLGVKTIQAGKRRLTYDEQIRMAELWPLLLDSIIRNQPPGFGPDDMAIVEKWTGDATAGPLFESYIDLLRKIDALPPDQARQFETAGGELLDDLDSVVEATLAELSDDDLETLGYGEPAEARTIQGKAEFIFASKLGDINDG